MSSISAAERPCFICGHGIPLEAFLEWPDTRDGRFAICGWCGAPNEQQDTAFLVLDRTLPTELPAPAIDVFPLPEGGWRAGCDCGLTEGVATQADGWSWVLDHRCMTRLDRPTWRLRNAGS
jgi:hypothetical protein